MAFDVNRRDFMRMLGAAGLCVSGTSSAALFAGGCGRETFDYQEIAQRVIVLGFDGVDAKLFEQWAGEGKLPNMASLMEKTYRRLRSTNPPESPVAWSSFITGVNPGKHRIFGFLKRDPMTHFPDLSEISWEKPEFLAGVVPTKGYRVRSNRKGTSFLATAARAGIRTIGMQVPMHFPPEEVPGGLILSGLGIPDIRGTQATFHYFATNLTEADMKEHGQGCRLVKLAPAGDVAEAGIAGLRDPRDGNGDLSVPVRFVRDAGSRTVTIELQGESETVSEGTWSRWFRPAFSITPLLTVHGICRFHVNSASSEIEVYMTPLDIDPGRPFVPISWPEGLSAELADEVTLFKTRGWCEETAGLKKGRIDEKAFMEDLLTQMRAREQITWHMFENHRSNLFLSVFYETDRVQHMFMRFLDEGHPAYDADLARLYGDSILRVYQEADRIVGRFMERLDGDTSLIVMSDHGFHSFRKGININTWLARNGFMHLRGMGMKISDPDRLYSDEDFFPNVIWKKTKAYALGLGQIYINLAGRERDGAVGPGSEYERVREGIIDGIKALRDPETGERVVVEVYKREDIYHGEYLNEAPDLQVGFRPGYRVSWSTCLGGVPKDVFVANEEKWCGDHVSNDVGHTPGIFLSNRGLAGGIDTVRIVDLAPTILKVLDVQPDDEMDGRALL